MEQYFFNEDIYLQDNKLYYEDKLIKKYNWHHILNDIGWEKLNIHWIKKLNKLSNEYNKNSLFGVIDCGGDGDCFFHCLSYALKSNELFNIDYDIDVKKLREMISNNINEDKFNEIINIYKIINDANEFYEDWDPNEITIDEFKEIIKIGGNNYWCDQILLNIIKEILNINLIILNCNEITNEYYYYPISYDYNENYKTIILIYEDEIHFRLFGYFFENNMITLFSKDTIPNEILKLIETR